MRERKRDWRVLVYKYGVYLPKESTPTTPIGDEALAMQAFWNQLTELEEQKSARYWEIIRGAEGVAAAEASLEGAVARLEAAKQAQRDRRQKERKMKFEGAEQLQGAIEDARKEYRVCAEHARALRKAAKETQREQIQVLNDEHFQTLRHLRSTIQTVSSGNRELILDRHKVAIAAARKEGTTLAKKTGFPNEISLAHLFTNGWPVERMFHGRAEKIQLQSRRNGFVKPGNEDAPPVTPPQTQWTPVAKRHRPLYTCNFLVGHPSKPQTTIEFDVFYHRPIPAGSLVKAVILHGKLVRQAFYTRSRKDNQIYRVPARWKWHLLVTCEIPHPNPLPINPGRSCGIDVGYRKMQDGSLRVAYLVGSDGRREELKLPKVMVDRLRYQWDLQSKADLLRAEKMQRLIAQSVPDDLPEEGRAILRKETIGPVDFRKLAAVALQCQPCGLRTEVENACAELGRLYAEYRGVQSKTIGWRTDFYRKWAHDVCLRYGRIIVEKLEVKRMAENEKEVFGHGEVGKYRAFAAPAHLLLMLKQCARKNYRAWEEKDPAQTTSACPTCGELSETNRMYLEIVCPKGHVYDQDFGAGHNILSPTFPPNPFIPFQEELMPLQ